jgi:hypothetical protein
MRRLAVGSPRPVPRDFVVKNGVKIFSRTSAAWRDQKALMTSPDCRKDRTAGRELASNDCKAVMDLSTTNVLLGILAAVSLLEAAAVIALLGGGFLLYRRLARLIAGIEERQIAPVTARVNAILDDVKSISAVAREAAGGADAGVRSALAWLLRRFRQAVS